MSTSDPVSRMELDFEFDDDAASNVSEWERLVADAGTMEEEPDPYDLLESGEEQSIAEVPSTQETPPPD
jgi:hypothetical protein